MVSRESQNLGLLFSRPFGITDQMAPLKINQRSLMKSFGELFWKAGRQNQNLFALFPSFLTDQSSF